VKWGSKGARSSSRVEEGEIARGVEGSGVGIARGR